MVVLSVHVGCETEETLYMDKEIKNPLVDAAKGASGMFSLYLGDGFLSHFTRSNSSTKNKHQARLQVFLQ